MSALAVALAVLAAALFAVAAAAQQRSAAAVPDDRGPPLVLTLVRRPLCLLGAAARRGTARAVLLAVATGVLYGLAAALTKGAVGLLGDGVLALLTSWETYGLVIALVGGTLLQQSAFQAGALGASLPAVAVGEPVVAVGVGVGVLHERLRVDGAEWVLIGGLVVVMVVATVALARSAARVQRVGVG